MPACLAVTRCDVLCSPSQCADATRSRLPGPHGFCRGSAPGSGPGHPSDVGPALRPGPVRTSGRRPSPLLGSGHGSPRAHAPPRDRGRSAGRCGSRCTPHRGTRSGRGSDEPSGTVDRLGDRADSPSSGVHPNTRPRAGGPGGRRRRHRASRGLRFVTRIGAGRLGTRWPDLLGDHRCIDRDAGCHCHVECPARAGPGRGRRTMALERQGHRDRAHAHRSRWDLAKRRFLQLQLFAMAEPRYRR